MLTSPTMRLLHVIRKLDPDGGGPPELLRQLGRAYAAIGTEMEALTVDDPNAPFFDRFSFPVHGFGPSNSTFGYSAEARKWLDKHAASFDGIIIDGLWQYPGLRARRSARLSGIPYLVFPHGMLDPWFRHQYPAKHVKKQLFWWLQQYAVLRDASCVVFTTEAERECAMETFWPNRWHSTVVPLGTARPEGEPTELREAFWARCPAVRGRRFLLFLSRIHEKKGCDLLIKAFRQIASDYPDLDLVMAGPADESGLKSALESLVRVGGLESRVHWTGMLEGKAKWGAFSAAEVFVLPSHQENFGIAVAEAIASQLPVLISNKINIWPYITEDGTGLVDDDTEEGTLRLLRGWLTAAQTARETMVRNTLLCFERRFSMEQCALRICALVDAARREPSPFSGSPGSRSAPDSSAKTSNFNRGTLLALYANRDRERRAAPREQSH